MEDDKTVSSVKVDIQDLSKPMCVCVISSYFIPSTIASSNWTNLALGKPADQSSTNWGSGGNGDASKAVDGNKSGRWDDKSCSRTGREKKPWWQVDLQYVAEIKRVCRNKRMILAACLTCR